MNEEQKIDKTKLPTKTKIAVWWLIGMGIVLIIAYLGLVGFILLYDSFDGGPGFLWNVASDRLPVILLFASIFYLISGVLILRKSHLTWMAVMSMLTIVEIVSLYSGIYYVMLGTNTLFNIIITLVIVCVYLTPIILLILDRKNYSEMLRQRELEKKATK